LALDYSGERWRPLPIMLGMTTGTITRHMRVRQQFGIGAMLIRVITLRYLNARFRGDRLFSSQVRNLACIGAA
jgi:hypothetical protein